MGTNGLGLTHGLVAKSMGCSSSSTAPHGGAPVVIDITDDDGLEPVRPPTDDDVVGGHTAPSRQVPSVKEPAAPGLRGEEQQSKRQRKEEVADATMTAPAATPAALSSSSAALGAARAAAPTVPAAPVAPITVSGAAREASPAPAPGAALATLAATPGAISDAAPHAPVVPAARDATPAPAPGAVLATLAATPGAISNAAPDAANSAREELKVHITEILKGAELEEVNTKTVREQVEQRMGREQGALKSQRETILELINEVVEELQEAKLEEAAQGKRSMIMDSAITRATPLIMLGNMKLGFGASKPDGSSKLQAVARQLRPVGDSYLFTCGNFGSLSSLICC